MNKSCVLSNSGLQVQNQHVKAMQSFKFNLGLMKSKVLVGIFLLVIPIFMAAQNPASLYKVKGQVVENNTGKDIPYVTVILKKDSTNEKKAQVCDGSGHFSFNVKTDGKYELVLSAIGYKEVHLPVNIINTETNLGQVQMELGAELKTVTVTAQKPLVRTDIDKIIYSMESDPDSKTNSALEMFRKVPLITVDAEDNVSLNGQKNFKVLVNGKSSSMMANNLKDVLKSFPANTIKEVEVITNPPSKYDAEGIGGIINIITLKKNVNGFNGSITSGVDSRGSVNGSTYIAAKINKFGFSTRIYGGQYKYPNSYNSSNSEYFNNSNSNHYSNANGGGNYKGGYYSFSGEASYDIDSLNLISLSFWGYAGSSNNESYNETKYSSIDNQITRHYLNTNTGKNGYATLSGNIDYQKLYKTPGKSFTISYKLDNNPRTTENVTDVIGYNNTYPTYHQQSSNDALGREQTFQTDFYNPLSKMHEMECGVKLILRQNTSNSETYRDYTLDNNKANDLDYDQYILGAYAGYVFKLKKFSTKTGIRFERTWNDGVSKSSTNTYFTNRLFNIVPYITLSYQPKQGSTVKLSYTQRLSRPGIWYLNPYVNDVDSMNINYGNPSLKSQISHSFQLGYNMFMGKTSCSITSSASFTNNSIENISWINSNGATVATYQNIGKNQYYGLNGYASYRPTGKLELYFNGGARYIKMEATNGYAISNKGFSYNGYLGGRWTFIKDFSLSVNGGLYSPTISLQGKSEYYYYTTFGISKYFLERKLSLNLSANQPFWDRMKYTSEKSDPTFYSRNEYSELARSFRFSITYNFGKMGETVKKAKRGIQNDDVKSGGSGSSGSGNNAQSGGQ